LPDLIRQQERRSVDFPRNAREWLKSLETMFAANRLHEAGIIAVLRSGLLAVEQGQVPAGLEFRGRPSRSRIANAAAAQALQRAADVVSNVIAQNQARVAEGERVARQIVAVSISRELIPAREGKENNTEYLRGLRRNLAAHVDLESAAVHLDSLVGPHDALVLIDRALLATSPEVPSTKASLNG
jgi:hypothetical protein